jgi:16S rRNA (adenine1518-N6/adenine1519-N6)-dimethyltransferase
MTENTLVQTKQLLRRLGVRPSKERGQTFLIDGRIADRICDAAQVGPEDLVLEIGAGLGCLTGRLADRAGRVVAVEADGRLAHYLHDHLRSNPAVEVVAADVLKMNFSDLLSQRPHRYLRVVANLPYRITSPTIGRILESRAIIDRAIITMQYEVACRLTSPPGTRRYGPLSIAVQYWSTARILFQIAPSAFYPRPKVRSATVEVVPRNSPAVSTTDVALFFRTVKGAFAQRRKMLRNALRAAFPHLGTPWSTIEALADIDLRRRAETLSLEEFARLADALGNLMEGADQEMRP